MTDPRHILLLSGERPLPSEVTELLESHRPTRVLSNGRAPSPEDLENADLVVVTQESAAADPPPAPTLRGLTNAPLLLLREDLERIPGASRDS